MSVTVSGNIQDLTGTVQAGYCVFTLENYGTNVPRIIGTTMICNRVQKVQASGAGVISTQIIGNDTIDPAGTFYFVTILDQNQNQLASYAFNITGATFNLNSATPISTLPIVSPPTGDSTYQRLDGGNKPTGSYVPNTTSTIDLGTSSAVWRTGYFTNVSGPTGGVPLNLQSSSGIITIPNTATIQNAAQTAAMGITRKLGTGAGNYSSASTTYVRVDSTNLAFVVTVPTSWKLWAHCSGAIGVNTAAVQVAVALADGTADNTGILPGADNSSIIPSSFGNPTLPFSLDAMITGDGFSHTINLQYKTSNAADSVVILNNTLTAVPIMVFLLMPSN